MITQAPPPAPAAPPPARRARPGGAKGILLALPGWLAVVAVVVAVAISVVPLRNPGVQDCGAPAAYLLGGRVDSYPDANGRLQRADGTIATLSKAELTRAFDHQCSKRVSARMVPVAVLLSAGLALGVVVLVASLIGWWRSAPIRPPAPDHPGPDPHP